MASYKEFLNIDNPNRMGLKELKQAVLTMASAANKRLRNFAKHDISYGGESGDDVIAGVKRFSVAGKDKEALEKEYKRVRNYLVEPQSSITGMKKAFREFKKRIRQGIRDKSGKVRTRKDKKDFQIMNKQKKSSNLSNDTTLTELQELKQWRETWTYYNRLVEMGYYAPTSQDSNQVRNIILAIVKTKNIDNMSEDEAWDMLTTVIREDYESKIREDLENELEDLGTSGFIFGSSE